MFEKTYLNRAKSARIGLRELVEQEFYGGTLYTWHIKKENGKYHTNSYGDILLAIATNDILIKFKYYSLLTYMEKINVLP